MNTKDKGNIGEAVIISEFVKRYIPVSIPFGDNLRYDLIAEFNNKLNKIQIKYCNQVARNGDMICPCSYTGSLENYDYTQDVDYMCFYLAPIDKCVIVPIDKIGSARNLVFRENPIKEEITIPEGINMVKDYLFDSILEK